MKNSNKAGNGDLQNLLARIETDFPRLPKKLQEIASFSFEHPDRVALNTISDLASQVGVYPSAFVRYAQRFGLRGFSDLQRLYRDHFRSQLSGYQARLKQIHDANAEEVLRSISEAALHSTTELHQNIDRKALGRAVDLMTGANTIWLAGTGRTGAVKTYLQYLLTGFGIVSQPLSDNFEQALTSVDLMTTQDVLIATTFRPYNPATIALVTKARANSIPVISMTDTVLSPIYGATTSLLYTEDHFAGFRSLSATVNLALYLAVQVGRRRQKRQPVRQVEDEE